VQAVRFARRATADETPQQHAETPQKSCTMQEVY
jgi:hypothetical protein